MPDKIYLNLAAEAGNLLECLKKSMNADVGLQARRVRQALEVCGYDIDNTCEESGGCYLSVTMTDAVTDDWPR